jgi:hypothetical protein
VAVGHHRVLDEHLDVTRGAQHVDPVIGIAGLDEDLPVLLEPGVGLVPLEGHIAGELGHRGQRLGVGPHGILDDAVAATTE